MDQLRAGDGASRPWGIFTTRRLMLAVVAVAGVLWLWVGAARSVTWPIADVERGRSIDLKVMFPEAFR